jgi:hypothetical protein
MPNNVDTVLSATATTLMWRGVDRGAVGFLAMVLVSRRPHVARPLLARTNRF